jgi:CheY-like chemotaxis protein
MNQGLRVFVVDDIPMIAYTLSALLRDRGHSVIPYTDPTQALDDAGKFVPDVLISDVDMPGLSGVDLAIQVQTLCPCCKVLLMSGHIGPIEDLGRARAKGFHFPLFAKPVSAQTFAKQLEGLSAMSIHRSLATAWSIAGVGY